MIRNIVYNPLQRLSGMHPILPGPRYQSKEKQDKFLCDEKQCPMKFKTKLNLDSHMFMVHHKHPYSCVMSSCMNNHYRIRNTPTPMNVSDIVTYSCNPCDEMFSSIELLQLHQQNSTESIIRTFIAHNPNVNRALRFMRIETLINIVKWLIDVDHSNPVM